MSTNATTEERANHPINPYAPPHAAPTKPQSLERTKSWFRRACVAQLLVIVASLGLEAIKVDTIIGTGPTFFVVGLFTAVFARREANAWGILLGASAMMLTIAIFVLINFYGWSPRDADLPVSIIIWCYSAIAVPSLFFFVLPRDKAE